VAFSQTCPVAGELAAVKVTEAPVMEERVPRDAGVRVQAKVAPGIEAPPWSLAVAVRVAVPLTGALTGFGEIEVEVRVCVPPPRPVLQGTRGSAQRQRGSRGFPSAR
jgi:hypothetical protein